MSTQSSAVESMVVAALKDLFADESAVRSQLDQLRASQGGSAKPRTLFKRVKDLDSRARRVERLLDAMVDRSEIC